MSIEEYLHRTLVIRVEHMEYLTCTCIYIVLFIIHVVYVYMYKYVCMWDMVIMRFACTCTLLF